MAKGIKPHQKKAFEMMTENFRHHCELLLIEIRYQLAVLKEIGEERKEEIEEQFREQFED